MTTSSKQALAEAELEEDMAGQLDASVGSWVVVVQQTVPGQE
jgi:hypothetical protein